MNADPARLSGLAFYFICLCKWTFCDILLITFQYALF